jgi:anthraniloyl-CoA monooxygenase
MKIACVGAGPAGLYFAIAAKLRDPRHEITVLERDPCGATYGWGVVFWDDLLDLLYVTDPDSARMVRGVSTTWRDQQVHLGREVAHLGGYGFAAQRADLLGALASRARQLGVVVEYDQGVEPGTALPDADLVVAADGAGSPTRQRSGDAFGTRIETGRNPYVWLGTDRVFDSFVFAFEETPAGWIWFHAYPSGNAVSTCIVECAEETWRGLGMDRRDVAGSLPLLESVFERPLQGRSLISRSRGEPARWLRFRQVTNATLHHDNVVLLGDAGHTTHFTIGSGTRLAMIDAVELVRSLGDFPDDLAVALQDFDTRARPPLRRLQARARASMNWYENADIHLSGLDALQAAYSMASRGSTPRLRRYARLRSQQWPPVRRVRSTIDAGRRVRRAARRGEFLLVPAWHPGPPPAGPHERPRVQGPSLPAALARGGGNGHGSGTAPVTGDGTGRRVTPGPGAPARAASG